MLGFPSRVTEAAFARSAQEAAAGKRAPREKTGPHAPASPPNHEGAHDFYPGPPTPLGIPGEGQASRAGRIRGGWGRGGSWELHGLKDSLSLSVSS